LQAPCKGGALPAELSARDPLIHEASRPIPRDFFFLTATITTGLAGPTGLKHDGAGNLYVADANNYVAIYNPPFSNASAPSVKVPVVGVWGIFVDPTGNLWAVDRGDKKVEKFTPPFTNTSTPTLTISTGLTDPAYPALDGAGNLYVSNFGGPGSIHVYLAPLSMASAPAFSLPSFDPNGIRFGP
jgi:streptogramin lyase